MNSESTLSDALSEVDTALAASDNERAAGLASELLLAYPNAVSVLRQRARALASSGRSLQAAEVHRRVLEILPADGEAMAGLARTLHTAGQSAESREAARQALDYSPGDESLKHIATGESQPFQPDDASMLLRKSLAQTQVGLLKHGIAGLRNVASKWPDRVDAKVALMQALWHNGARIGAAEQAQAVLDDYPNCLNAHLLMLEMWRAAGNSDMERIHQQAIDQVDPDHRVTHAMMGTQSPLQVKDVPARPSTPTVLDEEALSREDWVDNLVAASMSLPKPLEQLHETETQSPSVLIDDIAADVEAETDDETDFVTSLLPLEWSAASDFSEESARDDFAVSWIDGDVKDAFSPARPRAAVPDPRDGVPEALDPLEWEFASDEPVASAQARQDFSTSVDGGPAKNAAEPGGVESADEPGESDFKPLKTLAAAGAIAAAKQNADAPTKTELASAEAEEARSIAAEQQPLHAGSPAAQDSLVAVEEPAADAPAQANVTQPADAQSPAQTSDEKDGTVAKAVAATAALGAVVNNHPDDPAPAATAPAPAVEQPPATVANAQPAPAQANATQPADAESLTETADEKDGTMAKAVAATAALGAVVNNHPDDPAPAAIAPAPVVEQAPAAVANAQPAPAQANATQPADAQSPAEPVDEKDGTMAKAVAATAALGAVFKRRKKKAAAQAAHAEVAPTPVVEQPPAAVTNAEPAPAQTNATQPSDAQSPAEPADEKDGNVVKAVAATAALGAVVNNQPAEVAHVEPAGKDVVVEVAQAEPAPAPAKTAPAKPSTPKRAKKPVAKTSAREVQTEKVRKTYERAIASTKREDMPKLITELSQAAEMDPDNKIIFELLGQAYNRSGDIPAAINAYRRALEL